MLSTQDLHFGYHPRQHVLRGLTAALPAAAVTAVIGPNGSGKSTLLRLLLGTLTPRSGTATLDQTPTCTLPPRTRAARLGYIAQRTDLAEAFTVRQYVALGRFVLPPRPRAAEAALDRCGLTARADDLFGELSAGQQQRATLARVLTQLDGASPASCAILADEPASAMDPRHALFTLGVLREQARRGVTVAVVLHDLTLAARLADHVWMLDDQGRLAAEGPPAQVLTPDNLQRVFGVGFERLEAPGGGAMLAPVPMPH